ncbi:MAG: hypothetical protein J5817_02660 [Treponema sp.]|nr:hypothetical protein [Treponema sp.]
MPWYNGHHYEETGQSSQGMCPQCGGYFSEKSSGCRYYYVNDTTSNKKFCSVRCFKEYADMHPKDSSVGSCFITTATCKSRNLPDDCHELTTLRVFRDSFMKIDSVMRAEVEEYYKIAPVICSNIDKLENSDGIYNSIWKKYLAAAISAVDNNRLQEAHDIYKQMVLELKEKFYNQK